jgi:hypothetical protein
MSKNKFKDFNMPEFYDRKETYNIIIVINKIQDQRLLYKKEELVVMYKDFSLENPELFEKCCNEKLTEDDKKNMCFLINLRTKVKNNEISFQKASNIVSVYFANKYQPELLQKDGFKK